MSHCRAYLCTKRSCPYVCKVRHPFRFWHQIRKAESSFCQEPSNIIIYVTKVLRDDAEPLDPGFYRCEQIKPGALHPLSVTGSILPVIDCIKGFKSPEMIDSHNIVHF